MKDKAKKKKESDINTKELGCCNIESVVTVDERGQMVLPKEIRDKANIRPGDKLAVINWKKGANVCCISLIKTDNFNEMVKSLLSPMMKEITKK